MLKTCNQTSKQSEKQREAKKNYFDSISEGSPNTECNYAPLNCPSKLGSGRGTVRKSTGPKRSKMVLAGLDTQTQNAAFFERKGPERKPWPRGKSLNRKNDRNAFFER